MLETLWTAYKRVLPTLDGYIQEGAASLVSFRSHAGGIIHMDRLEALTTALSHEDRLRCDDMIADTKFLESKTGFCSVHCLFDLPGKKKAHTKLPKVEHKHPHDDHGALCCSCS